MPSHRSISADPTSRDLGLGRLGPQHPASTQHARRRRSRSQRWVLPMPGGPSRSERLRLVEDSLAARPAIRHCVRPSTSSPTARSVWPQGGARLAICSVHGGFTACEREQARRAAWRSRSARTNVAFAERMRNFFTTEIPAEIRAKGDRGEHADPRRLRHHAADPQRARAGRAALADRVGRPGLDADPAPPVGRRDGPGARPAAAGVQRRDGRAGDRDIRHRGAEAALPAADRQPRHLVVPGLLRAQRRLRSRVAQDHGRSRRRRVRRQRTEDVDDARAVRRLDLLPGAHQPGGEEAAGHLVPADRHARARA